MTIKIQVTEEDIKNGKRLNSHCCPIALACKRAVGKDWAEVFDKLQDNNPDGGWGVFTKWPILTSFIECFDKGIIVSPFEVELPDYIRD